MILSEGATIRHTLPEDMPRLEAFAAVHRVHNGTGIEGVRLAEILPLKPNPVLARAR